MPWVFNGTHIIQAWKTSIRKYVESSRRVFAFVIAIYFLWNDNFKKNFMEKHPIFSALKLLILLFYTLHWQQHGDTPETFDRNALSEALHDDDSAPLKCWLIKFPVFIRSKLKAQ